MNGELFMRPSRAVGLSRPVLSPDKHVLDTTQHNAPGDMDSVLVYANGLLRISLSMDYYHLY